MIGRKQKRGSEIGSVYGRRKSRATPDSKQITWNYQSKGWKKANENDFNIECVDQFWFSKIDLF